MSIEQIAAAQAFVNALSTDDEQAAKAVSRYLAADVTMQVGPREFFGHDEVLARITGMWP